MKRKRILIMIVTLVGLLSISGLSQTGRTTVGRLWAWFQQPKTAAVPADDVEQRARTRHGWDKQPVNNSVVRGVIIYYQDFRSNTLKDRDSRISEFCAQIVSKQICANLIERFAQLLRFYF